MLCPPRQQCRDRCRIFLTSSARCSTISRLFKVPSPEQTAPALLCDISLLPCISGSACRCLVFHDLVTFLANRIQHPCHMWRHPFCHTAQVLFCTLNPADVLHPYTLHYSNAYGTTTTLSLPMLDTTLKETLKQFSLARIVAEDPVAATRGFYKHVRSFATDLLACTTDPQQLRADGIAATNHIGIFGPLSAFFGAVEAQLRGSLHIHMILYMYGFNNPQSFVRRFQSSRTTFETRLWAWVNSIMQTSLEAMADFWAPDPDLALERLQPLPYTPDQIERLGDAVRTYLPQAIHGWRAAAPPEYYVPAPGPWYSPYDDDGLPLLAEGRFQPAPLAYLGWGPEASDTTFAKMLLYDARESLVACALHSCRHQTCRKGWLGRRGYCRLGFWHWDDISTFDSKTPLRPPFFPQLIL